MWRQAVLAARDPARRMAQAPAAPPPGDDVVRQLCSIAADYAESRRRGKDDAAATWRRMFDMTADSRAGSVDRRALVNDMAAFAECKVPEKYLRELAPGSAPLSGALRPVPVDRRALASLIDAVLGQGAPAPYYGPASGALAYVPPAAGMPPPRPPFRPPPITAPTLPPIPTGHEPGPMTGTPPPPGWVPPSGPPAPPQLPPPRPPRVIAPPAPGGLIPVGPVGQQETGMVPPSPFSVTAQASPRGVPPSRRFAVPGGFGPAAPLAPTAAMPATMTASAGAPGAVTPTGAVRSGKARAGGGMFPGSGMFT